VEIGNEIPDLTLILYNVQKKKQINSKLFYRLVQKDGKRLCENMFSKENMLTVW
jgi:hypothetical protein